MTIRSRTQSCTDMTPPWFSKYKHHVRGRASHEIDAPPFPLQLCLFPSNYTNYSLYNVFFDRKHQRKNSDSIPGSAVLEPWVTLCVGYGSLREATQKSQQQQAQDPSTLPVTPQKIPGPWREQRRRGGAVVPIQPLVSVYGTGTNPGLSCLPTLYNWAS